MMDEMDFLLNVLSSLGTIVALVTLTYQIVIEKTEKRQRQANEVSMWVDNMYNSNKADYSRAVVFCNHSNHPIYEVYFSILESHSQIKAIGTGEKTSFCINTLPPGKYVVIVDFVGCGADLIFEPSITFRDHSGKYWTRHIDGKLIRENETTAFSRRLGINHFYAIMDYGKISC